MPLYSYKVFHKPLAVTLFPPATIKRANTSFTEDLLSFVKKEKKKFEQMKMAHLFKPLCISKNETAASQCYSMRSGTL